MSCPLVTVVIPCYNHEQYVQNCILSILSQEYTRIELIVIDDGSSDGSVDKIKQLASDCERRFESYKFIHRENKGLCKTLNEAIGYSSGKYISTIASDDAILPGKIRKQVEYLERNSKCAAVFGGVHVIDEDGRFVREKKSKVGSYSFEDIILMRHSFLAPTQLIRTEVIRRVGLYDESIYLEDFYMWLKLASEGYRLDDLGESLSFYRRHATNMSGDIEKMDKARRTVVDGYKGHPLYRRAIATLLLSRAVDTQLHGKFRSLPYAMRSIGTSIHILYEKRFYKYLVKMFVPRYFMYKRHAVGGND